MEGPGWTEVGNRKATENVTDGYNDGDASQEVLNVTVKGNND